MIGLHGETGMWVGVKCDIGELVVLVCDKIPPAV